MSSPPRECLQCASRGESQEPLLTADLADMRVLMTSFGYDDAGGGTAVPREVSKELVRRGHEVTVFHAAVPPDTSAIPYRLRSWEQDGVRLVGVHNRPSVLFDQGNPDRELSDPQITAAFARALEDSDPEVVHFHNLHNLGAALFDEVAVHGIPAYFTTHNYWLICPRAYLMTSAGNICPGPGDGSACATCNHAQSPVSAYMRRLAEIRARAESSLTAVLAVSHAVRNTLIGAGYPPQMIDVVRQAMPQDAQIWQQAGSGRQPGRGGQSLTVAFLGSAYPHKGPQLLIEAAQMTRARVNVKICGEVPERFGAQLRELDQRGVVSFTAAFTSDQIGALLADVDATVLPSLWWDCAPLSATEALAAGTPLIVPRLGGLEEAIRDGVDGLLFDAMSVEDLARQIDRLATENGLLESLQAGIRPPLAFPDYVDQLEQYYEGSRPGQVHSPPARTGAGVRWKGPFGDPASLAIINDQVTQRLSGPVQRVTRGGAPLDRPLAAGAAVEVRHEWPPDFSDPPSGTLAMIVPWEFGAIPIDWATHLRETVDELWVPSEFTRSMYLEAGIDAGIVHTIPNGVDIRIFNSHGPARPHNDQPTTRRFLFVGGVTGRKGPDVLCAAWTAAFAGRDDVTLVIKDSGVDGAYRTTDRSWLIDYLNSGQRPRIDLICDDLSNDEIAALYRSCDVLVHPYRGEAFAMPVLEAMACGLPVITTAGGPTDEFCPPGAGWRIRSRRKSLSQPFVDHLETGGLPWVLEPEREHLQELLQLAAAADRDELRQRGQVGAKAAQDLTWDHVAARYDSRLTALASRRPRRATSTAQAMEFEERAALKILATPAWRGRDELPELLRAWATLTSPQLSACLYLLADPATAGGEEHVTARIYEAAAAAGAELAYGADINVLFEPLTAARDHSLIRSVDVYVPLHPACAGYERIARASGCQVATSTELERWTASISSARPLSANGSAASALSSS